MDRRRSLLKIAALRSEREQQVGVNCTKGYLESTDAGLLFDGPRSMECFFNLRQSDGTQRPAQFSTSMLAIAVTPMDAIMFRCGDKSLQVSRVTIGDDIHAVISYDGATAMCYINGIEVGAMQPTAYTPSALFRIGDPLHITKSPVHFCRHFNYALSAEEVAAHYNNGDPAGYVVPLADKYRWEASESNIRNIRFYPNNKGSGVTSYLEDNANGFTGRYAHIISGSSGLLSVYSYRFMGHPVGCVVEAKFKYRSNAPVRVLADNSSLPINMEDAADATIVYRTTGTNISGFSVTVPNADANSWVEIQPVSLRTLGCIAEYLPQNLVGSPHDDPIEIVGKNSYTWTGADAPVSFDIKINRVLSVGGAFRITGSVSNYKSGTPYLNLGHNSIAYLPKDNSPFTLVVTLKGGSSTLLPYIYIYGGSSSEDKQLTITVDSIEPVPGVATSWLDSAKQLPLNDEYLPPLLEAIVEGDATPIRIMGNNSYTWAGTESAYATEVELSRLLVVDQIYRVSITLSGYEAGTPDFKISSEGTTKIPKADGVYTFDVRTKGMPYRKILLYGGMKDSDRRLTLTVNSIEPVVERGYDLAANGTPQIIIK